MNIFLQSIGFLGLFASLTLAGPECPNTLAFYNPNERTTCYNASQSFDQRYIYPLNIADWIQHGLSSQSPERRRRLLPISHSSIHPSTTPQFSLPASHRTPIPWCCPQAIKTISAWVAYQSKPSSAPALISPTPTACATAEPPSKPPYETTLVATTKMKFELTLNL